MPSRSPSARDAGEGADQRVELACEEPVEERNDPRAVPAGLFDALDGRRGEQLGDPRHRARVADSENARVVGRFASSGTGTRTPNSTSRVSRVANYTIPEGAPKDSRAACRPSAGRADDGGVGARATRSARS